MPVLKLVDASLSKEGRNGQEEVYSAAQQAKEAPSFISTSTKGLVNAEIAAHSFITASTKK